METPTSTEIWQKQDREPRVGIGRPVDEAHTLPGAVYHEPAFYDLEKQNLWRGSWVVAAEVADVSQPGDVVPRTNFNFVHVFFSTSSLLITC